MSGPEATDAGDAAPGAPDGAVTGGTPGASPLLVLRGRPTPQQLAAVVGVLGALAAAPAAAAPDAAQRPHDAWHDPARRVGAPPAPGPGAWWASARP